MALTKETIIDKYEDIKGYEGRYAITEDGRVWSYPKNTNSKNGMYLKLDSSTRYKSICLIKDGVSKRFLVHRLVADAFCHKPVNCDQVNHIDGNRDNNHASNLEWVTASYNRKHAWNLGLQVASEAHKESAKKAAKSRRYFCDDEVRKIRMLSDMTFSQRYIADLFKTSQAVIQYITSRKTYSEVI